MRVVAGGRAEKRLWVYCGLVICLLVRERTLWEVFFVLLWPDGRRTDVLFFFSFLAAMKLTS